MAAAGAENRCSYWAIDHHQVAELTDRERALADLAVAVNNNPQSIRDADDDHLRELGLDDHLILEVPRS